MFGSEEEVDGGSGDGNWSEILVWEREATGPEEVTGLEEGTGTSMEVIETSEKW